MKSGKPRRGSVGARSRNLFMVLNKGDAELVTIVAASARNSVVDAGSLGADSASASELRKVSSSTRSCGASRKW